MTYKNTVLKVMAGLLVSSTVFAGPSDNIKDYSMKVREAAQSASKLAKDAKGNKEVILSNKTFKDIISRFNLSEKDQGRVAQAIADGKTYVVTALYASMAARTLIEQNQTDVKDVDLGIASIMKMAAVSGKGNATNKQLSLSQSEMADAAATLRKKSEYSIDMLSWGKEDADTHVAVMKRTAEIYDSSKTTPEEALVMAIMEVKGVDKDGAMKIIRKLRDCV